MTLLVHVVVGLVLGGLAWSALQPVFALPAFRRQNYRGADLATASGLVIVLAVVLVVAVAEALDAAGWSGDVAADAGRSAMVVVAVGFGFLGLLDDLTGGESGGGFRRHLAALRDGHLTTGAIKLAGGALVAIVVAAPLATDGVGQ